MSSQTKLAESGASTSTRDFGSDFGPRHFSELGSRWTKKNKRKRSKGEGHGRFPRHEKKRERGVSTLAPATSSTAGRRGERAPATKVASASDGHPAMTGWHWSCAGSVRGRKPRKARVHESRGCCHFDSSVTVLVIWRCQCGGGVASSSRTL